VTKLDDQLTALASMSPAQLRAEWRRIYRDSAPAIGHELLRRAIAHRLQEQVHGGLIPSVSRELDRMAKRLARDGTCGSDRVLKPGTRLVREWHGRTNHVLVLDQGFQFEDRVYRSLSQVAHAITGAKWSGPRFFGLNQLAESECANG
jgi:hypothetical protein